MRVQARVYIIDEVIAWVNLFPNGDFESIDEIIEPIDTNEELIEIIDKEVYE